MSDVCVERESDREKERDREIITRTRQRTNYD